MRRLAVIALVLVAAVLPLAVFRYLTALDRGLPSAPQTVVVPDGATGREIARLLESHGIIRSALAFDLLARIRGRSDAMKAGEFAFDAHRTDAEILTQVTGVGKQVAIWVTIPEGYTAREIAQTLAERDLGDAETLRSTFLDTSLEIDGERTVNLEGYLFPETYLVPTRASPAAIAKLMTDQFRAVLPRDAAAIARRLGFTIPQIVTVASLVEREARVDDERALMAGVYYNRLRLHMPLQVDATVEYTFARHKDVISLADLARDSPYNTYKRGGLPPTPIANPGRPSLEAAFFPRRSPYLYYVAMGNGRSAFSRTLAEHDRNVARYVR